jgi:hypothetical protein
MRPATVISFAPAVLFRVHLDIATRFERSAAVPGRSNV